MREQSVTFPKAEVEAALRQAKSLDHGEKGIVLEREVQFKKVNQNPSLLFLNFISGSGRGTETIEMIFCQHNHLNRVNIFQEYQGKTTTVFYGENLRPVAEIRAEQEQKRQLESEAAERAKEERRFRF